MSIKKEFIPYAQAAGLTELGFNEECIMSYPPLYQQAFRFFREKYNFTYSIGNTNISVVHYFNITQLLQNNESYEAAELETIKWFIDVAKQIQVKNDRNVISKTLVSDFMLNWATDMSKRLHSCLSKYFKDAFIEDINPKDWEKYRGCGKATWYEFEDYREAYLRIKYN